MKTRFISAVLTIILANVAIIGIAMLHNVFRSGTALGIGVESPAGTVDAFCSCLENGDFAELENMVYGYSGLNLSASPDTDGSDALYECLRSSYRCTPVGKLRSEGMSAEQDIIVEYFSVYDAREQIRRDVQEIYEQRLEAVTTYEEMFGADDALLESVALDIYDQALARAAQKKDDYMVSEQITVNLVYSEERWQIMLSEDLIRILLGNINRF